MRNKEPETISEAAEELFEAGKELALCIWETTPLKDIHSALVKLLNDK